MKFPAQTPSLSRAGSAFTDPLTLLRQAALERHVGNCLHVLYTYKLTSESTKILDMAVAAPFVFTGLFSRFTPFSESPHYIQEVYARIPLLSPSLPRAHH